VRCPHACKTKTEFESWYQTYNEDEQHKTAGSADGFVVRDLI